MKAGGVKFADTPDEAAAHAEDILKLEINGHMPRGVLVDPKAEVKQEYYASVVWDGTAKKPLMLFSDMGGIDIEEVAETHPDHVGKGHVSNLFPIPDFEAKQVVAATGVTGSQLNRATPILARLARLFRDYDMTLAEINPLAELTDGSFVALDAHMEMEAEAVGRQKELLRKQLEIAEDDTRETYEPSDFERNVAAIDAADHRGVIQGKDHGFTGNLGLVIGAGGGSLTLTDAVRSQGGKPANYSEIGGNPSVAKACGLAKEVLEKDGVEKIAVMMSIVSNTRVDIVARGVIKACLELGKDPGETIAIFRIPGAWEDEGFKILERYGVEYLRPLRLALGGRRPRRRQDPGGAPHEHPAEPRHHLHRPGDHRPRGGQPDPRVPRLRLQGRRRRHPRPQGPRGPRRAGLRHRRPGGRAPRRPDRRLGRHRPPRLHQGRRLRGDPQRDQADRRSSPSGSRAATSPRWSSWPTCAGARIIGPNCLGLIVPDVCKMGGIGGPAKDAAKAYAPGPVGVMSRSGGMTTEISSSLTQAGLGVSTAVSIGGDAIIGSAYAELMPYFEADEETKAIVIYTEPGGRMEAQLSEWVKDNNSRLPIVAFMAGKFMDDEEMKGMSFGHAGTIVEGKEDTATEKIARLEAAGIRVVERIDEIPDAVKEKLGVAA